MIYTTNIPLTPLEVLFGKEPRETIHNKIFTEHQRIELYNKILPNGRIPIKAVPDFNYNELLEFNINIKGHRLEYDDNFGIEVYETYDKTNLTDLKKQEIIFKLKQHLCSDLLRYGLPKKLLDKWTFVYDDKWEINFIDFMNINSEFINPNLVFPAAKTIVDDIGTYKKLETVKITDATYLCNKVMEFRNKYNTLLSNKLELIEFIDFDTINLVSHLWFVVYHEITFDKPITRIKI